MKKVLRLAGPVMSAGAAGRIRAWQGAQTDLVQCIGLPLAMHSADTNVTGNSVGGRTFVSGVTAEHCGQDGLIRQCKVWVQAVGDVGGWKFMVFRPNGANFDFIAASEAVTPAATGEQSFDLASPLPVQPGDVLGLWVPQGTAVQNGVGCDNSYVATATLKYLAGYQTGSNVNFTSSLNNVGFCIAGFSRPPYMAVTGDSIPEGHNCGASWHSVYDSGPAGTPTSEIANQLRGRLNGALQYQNLARGSQTFAWVASTGIVAAHALGAHTILIHCGVNDVSAARTWAQVEANLDTIRAALTAERLLVDEILPWTAGTDDQAATVRLWNSNLLTWCGANGATLVRCHDEMGQVRISTGELDDLKTAYNQDGVHLTQAGVDAMAAIWKRYL